VTRTNIQPLLLGTPLEDHLAELGLLVKREDLSCPRPGPPFSKMRGVISHMRKKVDEGMKVFGALDTFHSQAGHAVAYGAALLGVECVNYYPVYKSDGRDTKEGVPVKWVQKGPPLDHIKLPHVKLRDPQMRSNELGAEIVGLPAGRSAVLYHTAKKDCLARGGYMMPNALKLAETVEETAAEVVRTFERATREQFDVLRSRPWLISCSSATIASGVIKGVAEVLRGAFWTKPHRFLLHMGYDRSVPTMASYINERLGWADQPLPAIIVNEGYAYKDVARAGPDPAWPCNAHYDLKAFRWWLREGRARYGRAVLWNIG
jgi:hypothetical protein